MRERGYAASELTVTTRKVAIPATIMLLASWRQNASDVSTLT